MNENNRPDARMSTESLPRCGVSEVHVPLESSQKKA